MPAWPLKVQAEEPRLGGYRKPPLAFGVSKEKSGTITEP
jgi:hypothetical protein